MEGKELPDGWTSCYIEDLASYVTSGSRDWSKYYSSRGALFVRTENINTNRLSPLEEIARVELPASVEGKRTLISKDDLLITITGANVGKCAHVDRVIPEAYVSQSVALVRLLEPSLAGFIHKQLLAPSVDGKRTLLQESAYGIGRPVLSLADVRQVKIYLAPLGEQRRIAAKLDTTLAAVDACRQRLDGVAAILKRFRQAVLAAATSGELTREWREERGMEESWEEQVLGNLLSDLRYGTAQKCTYDDCGKPVLRIPNILEGAISHDDLKYAEFDQPEIEKLAIRAGDLLVIRSNGSLDLVGRTALASEADKGFLFAGYLIRLRPRQEVVNPGFLLLVLLSPVTRRRIELAARSTSGVNNINSKFLSGLQLGLPSLEEQHEIVRRAQDLFTLADQLEARLTAARKVVDRLTPALLAKAFRGELVPQDPSDEPASVLLDRIRAARQAEAGAGKPSRRGRRKAAASPDPVALEAAPVPPDYLAALLRECGALSERALLAASELEPARFRAQLALERQRGAIRDTPEDSGQVLLEASA